MRDEAYATIMEMLKECLVDARRVARKRGCTIPDPVATTWWEGDTFFLRLSAPEKKNRITCSFSEDHSTGYDALTSFLLEWY